MSGFLDYIQWLMKVFIFIIARSATVFEDIYLKLRLMCTDRI